MGNVEFLARTADSPRFNFGIIEIEPGRVLEAHVHVAEDDAFVLVPPGVEHGFRNDGEVPVRMFTSTPRPGSTGGSAWRTSSSRAG